MLKGNSSMKIKKSNLNKINTKKGFSLVELLAVIVILGLISVIGISVTSNLVDLSKRKKWIHKKTQ